MHHHPEPPRHFADWAKIARLEYDLYGETFHHAAPGCHCDSCVAIRDEQARALHEQTAAGWHAHAAGPYHNHDHGPYWILPPPSHPEARI